ncbi:MAG: aldehyde dehydrogenase [Actinobacteria bacterium]|nr:aldehyde dehydrogenase [Actinomycetota bacterium]
MAIDNSQVEKIVREVVNSLFSATGASALKTSSAAVSADGLFDNIEDAIRAAKDSQVKFMDLGRDIRFRIVDAIRKDSLAQKERLAAMTVEETKMGRVEDKIRKNEVGAIFTPGPEDLVVRTYSNENGTITIEGAPFGVIGAITPMTNPVPTIINNTIAMISAGNSVVYLPHPSAHNCTIEIFKIVHNAIVSAGGPPNLITAARTSKIENAATVFKSPDVDLIVVTGGPGIVRLAMKSGKRVMGAGPGNPPVVVDDTADLLKAAGDIVTGASFDNNILCNEEKICIVLRNVLDGLLNAFSKCNTFVLNNEQAQKVANIVVKDGEIVKSYMGKDCSVILQAAGISVDPATRLAVFVTTEDHPIVQHEQLMPILPIVAVNTFEEAVNVALRVEHNFKHTAVIHSNNIERITKFAQTLNTTYVIVNGPSQALAGEIYRGGTTWTIAGATGEGVTSPRVFVRERRLVVSGGMNFVK